MTQPNDERVLGIHEANRGDDLNGIDERNGIDTLEGFDELGSIDELDGIGEDDVEAMAALFATTDVAATDELAVARLARFARDSAVAKPRARPVWGLRIAGLALAAGLGGFVLRPSVPEPAVQAEVAMVDEALDGDWTTADPLDFFGTSASYAQADLLPDEFGDAWADDVP